MAPNWLGSNICLRALQHLMQGQILRFLFAHP
jgi:hypothetical protein